MTEERHKGSESHYVPERARQQVIATFKNNFDIANLSEGNADATLISLTFMQKRRPLEVSHFMGMQPTPFAYDHLDLDFVDVVSRYLKSDKSPTRLSDIFKLGEFKHMPVALRRYLGVRIQTTSTLYELVDSLDGKKNILSQTRYLFTEGESVINIAEIWKKQSLDQDQIPTPHLIPDKLPEAKDEFIAAS